MLDFITGRNWQGVAGDRGFRRLPRNTGKGIRRRLRGGCDRGVEAKVLASGGSPTE
ncbi:MAG: hypothetical protein U0792_18205 [Gemmataceae bacterium]